jgi:hypothetical protein
MNINILIDAMVRQTTVLIAQLATTARARASLSQTANQVFLDLVSELKEQGLGNKLIADMFGLSLRTYHNKMRRLSESSTERGESLWNAVLAFVQEKKTVARGEVLLRFARDDERSLKSVLNDLVATGMLFSKGTGDRVVYRAAAPVEYDVGDRSDVAEGLSNLLWISIARHSPVRRSRLLQMVRLEETELDVALTPLLADGRVQVTRAEGEVCYCSEECVIGVGETAGWEASIFDHYQAMVIAICRKLQLGTSTSHGETVGGSTYGFEVWPGHPLQDEVLGFLQATRDRAVDLRQRVDRHNAGADVPEEQRRRVIAYVGQTVIDAVDPSETEER